MILLHSDESRPRRKKRKEAIPIALLSSRARNHIVSCSHDRIARGHIGRLRGGSSSRLLLSGLLLRFLGQGKCRAESDKASKQTKFPHHENLLVVSHRVGA